MYIYISFCFKTRLKLIFKKVLTLIVSKYHKLHPSNVRSVFFFVSLLLSATSFQPFPLQRPIPFHFHLLPIIKYIRASSSSPLPLFIPHSLLLLLVDSYPIAPLSLPPFCPFPFLPPFFFLVICRGEAASAASSSIRRQIPTFCQRSARSHLQGSNKIKKPVTCTPVESSRLREACLAPSCNRVAPLRKNEKKERVFKGARFCASSFQELHSFERRS